MRDDIIDTVLADDLQRGDFIEEGEVTDVNPLGDYAVLVDVDGLDEPIEFPWDARVNLYGSNVVEV